MDIFKDIKMYEFVLLAIIWLTQVRDPQSKDARSTSVSETYGKENLDLLFLFSSSNWNKLNIIHIYIHIFIYGDSIS